MDTNYQRTATWLAKCGKYPMIPIPADQPDDGSGVMRNVEGLSVQIGCHLEEFSEFLKTLNIVSSTGGTSNACEEVASILDAIGTNLKKGHATALIYDREMALDALVDMGVTGNGVCYMAGFKKEEADQRVLDKNDDKFNADGTPVILPGGKIGKREGWTPPDLSDLV